MCSEPELPRSVAKGGNDVARSQSVCGREVPDASRLGVELVEPAPGRDVEAPVKVFGDGFGVVAG